LRYFNGLKAVEETMARDEYTGFAPEMEDEYDEYEYEQDEGAAYTETEAGGVLDEADEMELASALLEVTDEGELDEFIGNFVKRFRSPAAKALKGLLKKAALQALPIVRMALGGPASGDVAAQAGKLFGLELEGLSAEDQEFEAAKAFVTFAADAANNAAQAEPEVPPQTAARAGFVAAARQHAPGLVRPTGRPSPIGTRKRRGQWERYGRHIVVRDV
jgi:hypothetical protein